VLPETRLFCYRDGFGAGSVAAFSNVFRYTLLSRHGGWWIDTDVACLAADSPRAEVVFAFEDAERIGPAVLRLPAGHPIAADAVACWEALGEAVGWDAVGPELLTRLVCAHGLLGAAFSSETFYSLHWSEWLDLADRVCGDAVRARLGRAVALHLRNEKFCHHEFQRALAPLPGSMLHTLAEQHGGVGRFLSGAARVQHRHTALARAYAALAPD
jgi:hypothetical protein